MAAARPFLPRSCKKIGTKAVGRCLLVANLLMTNGKRKGRKKFIWLALIVCIGAGVGAWFHFQKREVVLTVQTEKVARRNITELVVANGKIQPVVQVVINP